MLPCEEVNKFGLYQVGNKISNGGETLFNLGHKPKHLYILSDEEIKEGDKDFYINTSNIQIERVKKVTKYSEHKEYEVLIEVYGNRNQYKPVEVYGKIIATTNPELRGLPQISQSFIETYIKEYNSGNIIKEVMIVYQSIQCLDHKNCKVKHKHIISIPRTDSNNVIIIRSYSFYYRHN